MNLDTGRMPPKRSIRSLAPTSATLLFAGLAMVLASASSARADNVKGAWSSLGAWPVVALHAALLPTGKVLTYGTNAAGQATGRLIYDIWDPAAGLPGGHTTLPNSTGTDIFCNAQIILPQSGDLFMAGGDIWGGTAIRQLGINDTNLFRTANSTLVRGPRMSRPRWYATLTTLLDGSVFIQGGRGNDPTKLDLNSDRPERRNLDGTISLLSGADTRGIYWYYPRNWVAPDGRIVGWSKRNLYFVDPRGTGMVSGMGTLPDTGAGHYTSSEVMFEPGRILRVGGGASYGAGSTNAYVVDVKGPVPSVAQVAPMPVGLHWHNATVLADGRVVVTGGSRAGNQLNGVNLAALIWNPVTRTWTRGAATASGRARLYHSTALLLPDASVLVAGGGADGPQTNLNAEIWYPPYLFTATGARAARPVLTGAPATVDPGQSFTVGVNSALPIARLALVKTGSVTHSFNMDQRFVPLAFTAGPAGLRVTLPASPGTLPPGRWMLFAIDSNGVPSIAALLSVRAVATTVAVDWTPSYGHGFDGTPATAACPAGKVMVGAYGRANTKLLGIGPYCVAVDAQLHWVGTPTQGPRYGVSTGGTAFTRLCPTGSAVVGTRGRSGADVDQLALICRGLSAGGKATGTTTVLASVGGTGGSSRPEYSCGTGNPGFAFYGRSGTTIRSVGLQCRQRS